MKYIFDLPNNSFFSVTQHHLLLEFIVDHYKGLSVYIFSSRSATVRVENGSIVVAKFYYIPKRQGKGWHYVYKIKSVYIRSADTMYIFILYVYWYKKIYFFVFIQTLILAINNRSFNGIIVLKVLNCYKYYYMFLSLRIQHTIDS